MKRFLIFSLTFLVTNLLFFSLSASKASADCDPTKYNLSDQHIVTGPNGFLGTTKVQCPTGECEVNAAANCSIPTSGICNLSCARHGVTTTNPTCPPNSQLWPPCNTIGGIGCQPQICCTSISLQDPLGLSCGKPENQVPKTYCGNDGTRTYDSSKKVCVQAFSSPWVRQTACDDNTTIGVQTAIGCIPTGGDLTPFLSFILKWALGAAGGIILLMLIATGYSLMTSSGNPEKLQAVKENLVSIFSGLILIGFSLVLLQAIGAGILNLPTF